MNTSIKDISNCSYTTLGEVMQLKLLKDLSEKKISNNDYINISRGLNGMFFYLGTLNNEI